jgi:uncharacterized membrane protein YhdT
MYTTNFTCHALRKKDIQGFVFSMALAICFLAAWMVFLFGKLAGKLGEDMKGWDMYCMIATLLFTVLALALYFTKRLRIHIKGANDKLTIEIKDPKLPEPKVIESPFSLRRQWYGQQTTRTLEMKLLHVTLMDPEGTALVTFTSALGAAYPAPPGFEFINIHISEERAQLSLAPLVYETGKTLKIEEELRIYLNFMENRAKKQAARQ